MSPEEAVALWRRLRAGEPLAAHDEATLAAALADDALRERVFADDDADGLIRAAAIADADPGAFAAAVGARLAAGRRSPPRGRFALAASAAAVAAILALVVIVRAAAPAPVVATIRAAGGSAAVWRGGAAVPASIGAELRRGDVVVAGGAPLELASSDGSAALRLDDDAVAQLAGDRRAKRIGLLQGGLDASVATQPTGSSLTARTDDAEALVVGTRFRLERATGGTRLAVAEGTVRFTDRAGRAQAVRAGEVATALAGVAPSDGGLIARWTFADAADVADPARDATGRGHVGRASSGAVAAPPPTPRPGGGAGALLLDGVDGHLVIDDAIDLRPARLTVAAWIRIPAGAWPASACLFARGPAGYSLETTADAGGVLFAVTADHPVGAVAVGLGVDRWHHVAGTFDGTAVRVYLDGREAQSTPLTAPLAHPRRAFVVIGSNPGDSSRFLRGALDDVRVYDRALPPAEIAALAAGAPAGAAAADGF